MMTFIGTSTIAVVCVLSVVGGIALTRTLVRKRDAEILFMRLARWLPSQDAARTAMVLIKSTNVRPLERTLSTLPMLARLGVLIGQCGFAGYLPEFLYLLIALIVFPVTVAFALGLNFLIALVAGLSLAMVSVVTLVLIASRRRIKFSEQMPDAIDLMVSVLRSGHSIPQAVKAVADELPAPCGVEFGEVMQRLNLGQALASALVSSAERFGSYEVDLMRRAVAIQSEVGGSLAELLEKTNLTLRARLKLVKQVRVLTAQARLTAIIVGLLPLVVAVVLETMSPGYLKPLFHTDMGRMLLVVAISLQGLGLFLMKKLSTVTV
ncbi:MAG: type II secretion system F family protein [Candidatus Melainabacteria bacterium]|nr:type II secretion system F family protein [Candidatus Melainabacteria bacterium]